MRRVIMLICGEGENGRDGREKGIAKKLAVYFSPYLE